MQNQWALVDVNVLAHSDTITAVRLIPSQLQEPTDESPLSA